MTDLSICRCVRLCIRGPTVTKSNTCGFWHINTLFNRWESACILLCHVAELVFFWHCESPLNSHGVVQTLPGTRGDAYGSHSTASVRRRPPASPQIISIVSLTRWYVKSTDAPHLHQIAYSQSLVYIVFTVLNETFVSYLDFVWWTNVLMP